MTMTAGGGPRRGGRGGVRRSAAEKVFRALRGNRRGGVDDREPPRPGTLGWDGSWLKLQDCARC